MRPTNEHVKRNRNDTFRQNQFKTKQPERQGRPSACVDTSETHKTSGVVKFRVTYGYCLMRSYRIAQTNSAIDIALMNVFRFETLTISLDRRNRVDCALVAHTNNRYSNIVLSNRVSMY